MKTVSVVIPCYNEEEALPLYFKAIEPIIEQIKDYKLDFVLVNDGSKDDTLRVMEELYNQRNDITIVNESRNYGQNAAISAGFKQAKGDYVIIMDVDLQDPVEVIPLICEKFTEGYEVVNPHRSSRKEDTWFKRTTAGLFYRFENMIEKKKIIPENVNCFRGVSRRVVDTINALPESDRFYVSLVPSVGFKTCQIDFVRAKRDVGTSKYNLENLFNNAFNIISTSTSRPLYTPVKVGFLGTGFFFVTSLILLILYILGECKVMPDYELIKTFMFISIIFFGVFLIIFFIGILALYLHNILINTRGRPNHIIDYVKRPEDKEKNDKE